jgi:hypothetical protein
VILRKIAVIMPAVILCACASAPAPSNQAPKDPTKEAWYAETVEKLAAQNREAARLWKAGKADDAAALIQSGETLASRLLAVPRPTLAAMQDASDLDDLYGRMLFSNHNYGWARLFFQKNAARWKNWQPQTVDTAARLKTALIAIDECDSKIEQ